MISGTKDSSVGQYRSRVCFLSASQQLRHEMMSKFVSESTNRAERSKKKRRGRKGGVRGGEGRGRERGRGLTDEPDGNHVQFLVNLSKPLFFSILALPLALGTFSYHSVGPKLRIQHMAGLI